MDSLLKEKKASNNLSHTQPHACAQCVVDTDAHTTQQSLELCTTSVTGSMTVYKELRIFSSVEGTCNPHGSNFYRCCPFLLLLSGADLALFLLTLLQTTAVFQLQLKNENDGQM